MRRFAALAAALLLAGCGSAANRAPQTAAPKAALSQPETAAPAPTPFATPRTEPHATPQSPGDPIPSPTILPVESTSVTLNSLTWRLRQPKGVAPVAAAGDQGVIWIHFPAMLTNDMMARYGSEPSPRGLYFVMYTPLRPGGGDLEQTAWRVATLPDMTSAVDEELARLSVSPIVGHRFLVRGYSLCSGCQNGGTEHVWVADPQRAGSPQALTSILATPGEGGGHFLTVAYNDRWLFWNAFDVHTPTPDPLVRDAHSFLIDLQNGQRREIDLGGANWTEQARWSADGKLHFSLAREPAERTLDPATGRVST